MQYQHNTLTIGRGVHKTQSERNIRCSRKSYRCSHFTILQRVKDDFISLLQKFQSPLSQDSDDFQEGCSWDAEWFQVSSRAVALCSAGKTSPWGGAWYRSLRRWTSTNCWGPKSQRSDKPFKNIYFPTERWNALREEDVQPVVASPTCNCLHWNRPNWGEGESSQLWSEVQRKFPQITLNSTELTWNSTDLTWNSSDLT